MRLVCRCLTPVVLVATLLAPASAQANDPCADGAPPAFFLAATYDAGGANDDNGIRDDFEIDVQNFEIFKASVADIYCMPSENTKILAFSDDYTALGTTYDAATEANVKSWIRTFGPQASALQDATFFFFLSSHGIAYGRAGCPGGTRVGGSLSSLGREFLDAENGDLYDCELGQELNANFDPGVRMAVYTDCSFCGGFSDSLTAVSGTVPDGSVPVPSGIVRPNRVVVSGCAVTTECFGSDGGAVLFKYMLRRFSVADCDGWTAPAFPMVQGLNLPERSAPLDGRCTASELHFAAVDAAYDALDPIAIQEQFRMKYGFPALGDDIAFL